MVINDIIIYPSYVIENTDYKNWWGLKFGLNPKLYYVPPSIVYPTKIRDRIYYIFKYHIAEEYHTRGEYIRNISWTKYRKALVIHDNMKPLKLDAFITHKGVLTPLTFKGEGVNEEMKIGKSRYETPFLKVEDLEDTVVTATIKSAEMQDTINDGKPDSRESVTFVEYEKPFILNKTNLRTLVDAFNEEETKKGQDADTSKWINKSVYLTVVDTNNPQTKQKVKGIRISIPAPKK